MFVGAVIVQHQIEIAPLTGSSCGSTLAIGETKINLPLQLTAANAQSVIIAKRNVRWEYQGPLAFSTFTGERPELQGPTDDAFARPFLCFHGTGKPWHPAVATPAATDLPSANLRRRPSGTSVNKRMGGTPKKR